MLSWLDLLDDSLADVQLRLIRLVASADVDDATDQPRRRRRPIPTNPRPIRRAVEGSGMTAPNPLSLSSKGKFEEPSPLSHFAAARVRMFVPPPVCSLNWMKSLIVYPPAPVIVSENRRSVRPRWPALFPGASARSPEPSRDGCSRRSDAAWPRPIREVVRGSDPLGAPRVRGPGYSRTSERGRTGIDAGRRARPRSGRGRVARRGSRLRLRSVSAVRGLGEQSPNDELRRLRIKSGPPQGRSARPAQSGQGRRPSPHWIMSRGSLKSPPGRSCDVALRMSCAARGGASGAVQKCVRGRPMRRGHRTCLPHPDGERAGPHPAQAAGGSERSPLETTWWVRKRKRGRPENRPPASHECRKD